MRNKALVTTLLICFLLSSCGSNEKANNNDNNKAESIEETSIETMESTENRHSWRDNYEYIDYGIDLFDDYQRWADSLYSSGEVTSRGVEGINEDYYHTLPENEEYNSGKIIIGDSRCFEMGIFEHVYDLNEYAVFAVWGGHFVEGRGFNILAEENLQDIEQCIISQIENKGECIIYLFASVNDYDYTNEKNQINYDSFVESANKLKNFKVQSDGKNYSPEIRIIGFDGCIETGDLYGTPAEDFNKYISEYNDTLKEMLNISGYTDYTTVMDIVGGKAGFTLDGLHYDEITIGKIIDYICERE